MTSLVLQFGKVVRVTESPEKVAELMSQVRPPGAPVRLQGPSGPVWVNPAAVATVTEADKGRP